MIPLLVTAIRKLPSSTSHFFQEEPKKPLSIPFFSPTKDLEVVKITRTEAYIVSHLVKGRYGFPNNFLEKELDIVATTRNWNTLDKIIK